MHARCLVVAVTMLATVDPARAEAAMADEPSLLELARQEYFVSAAPRP